MHARIPQPTWSRHRTQGPVRSTLFSLGSIVPALGAVAVVGALAACSTGASAAHEASITSATPTAAATPTTAVPPTTAAVRATAVDPTTVATAAPVTTPAPVERSAAVSDGLATVAGVRMHIRCVGSGTTTVLLIAGFGDAGDNWGAIEGPLAQDARVCSSSHLGTSTSDPPPGVQTFTSQATQLHAALESVGEPGPYVLVGHSFGGAEAVAFASMFPDQVTGLVLLDASPTTWPAASCAVPDDGSDAARSFHDNCTVAFHPDGNGERLDVPAAFAEVATITSLASLPMAVLTADTHTYPGLEAGAAARLNEEWNEGQRRWAAMSTAGHVVPVANTGHHIELDQPAIVVEQIQALSR